MTEYPTRDELNDEYTWDLSRVYGSGSDWEDAHDALADRIDALEEYDDPTASPEALVEALEAIETVLTEKSKLELYALLRRNEDPDDGTRRDRHRRSQRIGTEAEQAVQTLRRRIQRDTDAVRRYIETPALEVWEAYVEDLLAQAPHTRGAAGESVIATFEPVVEKQADAVVAITTGDYDAPTVEKPDGESFAVDRSSYKEAMEHPDREFRERAHQAFYGAMTDHEHALAEAVGQKVQAHAALAEARGFDSVREMAFSRASYPDTGMHVSFHESAHDAVIERVRDHLDAYHHLVESRGDCLGIGEVRPWDLRAPLVDDEPPEFDYESVREHVLAAVEPLGDDYRDRLATFLSERRVDVYPTERKRTDIPAYCPSSPETGAYVLANFREGIRTAFYLAHELGHAMHIEFLRAAQPPRYVNSPQPISEVPSLVHELLLCDHLLETEPEMEPFVQERRASLLSGNVFGSIKSAAFLHEVYRTVEEGGDLTPDRLSEIRRETVEEFHGPIEAVEPGSGWLREAFAREPYHSYQYATGTVAAVSIHQRIASGDLSTAAYLDFLRNTGRRDSEASFEALGVDVTDAETYDRLADELNGIREARPY
jgi:oligoendopeptidase F